MITREIRVHPSATRLPREDQLAWAIAEYAASAPAIDDDVAAMVACRIIDNAAVALASINRKPVAAARAMALAHPRPGGATLFGLPPDITVHAEWAAWANGTAVRELDYHDAFLAADYAHPGDNIPPLVAVAQQTGRGGAALARAIAIAYEIHIALVKSICLHAHKKDHIAHLCPAMAAGIGALLDLPTAVIYDAVNLAVHLSFSTRQSRKGEISSWKAFAPAFAGKTAIEAVDRAMRGEAAPNPIYEGEDSVIAWMLAGAEACYQVALPAPGEPPRAIMESYTKAHSAEYQAQALIDLAFEMRNRIDLANIDEIVLHTSHHTHDVVGTGANDPQKMDPDASRETLDHSIMYILAVALEDGRWHHVDSYTSERAHRPSTVALWHRIRTVEDPDWTTRYHEPDPAKRQFGGRLEIRMADGGIVTDEIGVAHAHPNGRHPWGLEDYIVKFRSLSAPVIDGDEAEAFIDRAQALTTLDAAALRRLHPTLPAGTVCPETGDGRGIFDYGQ